MKAKLKERYAGRIIITKNPSVCFIDARMKGLSDALCEKKTKKDCDDERLRIV